MLYVLWQGLPKTRVFLAQHWAPRDPVSCRVVTEGSHEDSHLVLACWLDLELQEVRGGGREHGNAGGVAVSAIR